jgi:hypothetical protein
MPNSKYITSGCNKPGEIDVPPEKRIQPGESRNPGGNPVMTKELKRAFREKTLDCLNILYECMMSPKTRPFDRIRAAECILDRGWGRPRESVDIDFQTTAPIVFADLLRYEAERQTNSSTRIVNEEE